MNAELVEAIDSSDQWIQERSGIKSRRFAAKDESVVDMSGLATHEALAHGRPARPRTSTPSSSPPSRTPTRPLRPRRSSPTASASRPPPSTSRPPAPATATASAWPATWCAAAAPATSWSIGVEKLSDFTDLNDRGSAFIFGDGAGAADRRSVRHPRHRPHRLGIGRLRSGRPSRSATPGSTSTSRACGWPAIGMAGQTVFRWAVWGMAPVAHKALDAAGVRAEDLDAFIPHQANMRIIDAMIKQLKLPCGHRRSPATSPRPPTPPRPPIPLATERMLRDGEVTARRPGPPDRLRRRPGVCRTGRRPAVARPELPPARG